jgi:hypothetical protein
MDMVKAAIWHLAQIQLILTRGNFFWNICWKKNRFIGIMVLGSMEGY